MTQLFITELFRSALALSGLGLIYVGIHKELKYYTATAFRNYAGRGTWHIILGAALFITGAML
jgi:hypothetical protein